MSIYTIIQGEESTLKNRMLNFLFTHNADPEIINGFEMMSAVDSLDASYYWLKQFGCWE